MNCWNSYGIIALDSVNVIWMTTLWCLILSDHLNFAINLRYIYCSSAGVYLKTDYLPHFEVSIVAYNYILVGKLPCVVSKWLPFCLVDTLKNNFCSNKEEFFSGDYCQYFIPRFQLKDNVQLDALTCFLLLNCSHSRDIRQHDLFLSDI